MKQWDIHNKSPLGFCQWEIHLSGHTNSSTAYGEANSARRTYIGLRGASLDGDEEMGLPAASKAIFALQDPTATARRELQRAAQEIRTQVQRELQEQARANGQLPPAATPPAPPIPPGVVVSPMEGEHQVYVGTGFPVNSGNEIPPQAVDMAMGFFFTVVAIIIGLPIARAFARRMDRKAVAPQIPQEVTQQLNHLAQAVDAIALEVERISEGQRFTTRLLSEQREAAQHALPTGSDR